MRGQNFLRDISSADREGCTHHKQTHRYVMRPSERGSHTAVLRRIISRVRCTACPSKINKTNENTKTTTPENPWKKPSDLSRPQYSPTTPVPMIRKPLATIAIGTAPITSKSRTHVFELK